MGKTHMIGLWPLAPDHETGSGAAARRAAISCGIVDDAWRKQAKWTSYFR